ncbi:hypothetical protein P0D87_25660 [Paraburkholderia sp. RL17-368-BIF-A]
MNGISVAALQLLRVAGARWLAGTVGRMRRHARSLSRGGVAAAFQSA